MLTCPQLGGSVENPLAWYAIRVKANFERTASQSLRTKGFEEFNPVYKSRRRWSDRTRLIEFPLFPGYVFCRFDVRERVSILQTPGVVSVISFGKRFVPVDERELDAVRTLTTSGSGVQPWPYLRTGQRVRVCGGAMNGVEGSLLNLKNGRRLVVAISLLQRAVAVELDRDSVEPVL